METALVMWRCIGCGAMGNGEACVGACDFKRLEVVDAQDYADLLEGRDEIDEQTARLSELARAVATLTASANDLASEYRALRERARKLLGALDRDVMDLPAPTTSEDERMTIWLCSACGQVEAPQDCLGICIRRMGEFVRAEACDKPAAAIAARYNCVRGLKSLLRQFAWVAPRAGQEEKTRVVFRKKAAELLQSVE
ncbi:septum formation initiator family protein [Rhodoblastus acidophilus]|uniref:Septum formation initiator family protein n=1 Tax=Candidatus Rhodoblastus alkanivorans TaxID=2954117 RepID=A0ABS9Z2A2_9HYPH|nr:septum formation initiator family protein [Candidatus Rhodoblastus alkanivorans]MCI4677425.1 septum formation initiator family protein [Candidatus Rhodoblastus alkanivorans]MCI4681784.1 septum formation initiator family protein [Candidatus Rhodoblastus alkanivorans]MDI4642833.1 septum formation initiator family protein [Rhodoblastus acidophilus]